MSKWEMVRLSSIATLMTDGNWIESKDQSPDGIRLLQVGNIGKGYYIEKADRAKYISEETFVKLKCTEVFDGDVLVSRLPDPIGRACIVPKLDTKLITAVDCTIIRTLDEKCCSRYLLHFLCSPQYFWQIEKFIVGSTRSRISRTNLQSISLPLPPLLVQQKIADILDRARTLIEKRKEQIAKLDLLAKSQFIEMFGDPVTNPMGWDVISLRESSMRISDGPFGSNLKTEHYKDIGVRVIRLGNIGVSKFMDNDKAFISVEHYETLKKHTCLPNDIIIGTLGEPNLRACILPDYIEKAINKSDCVHYKPNKNIANTHFVCEYLNQPAVLSIAGGSIHGQTRSRISMNQVAALPIFLPPLDQQHQFADFVRANEKSKFELQQGLEKLELLYKSLMQKCFGGEVF
ncbi:MAG: restriction endonuclease subunit S [Oscillospiraceae bacterium]|nr:restriction endonuclease subunit S [Oscillospiraceae bacterium]